MTSIGFIGAGNMGAAIIKGILGSNLSSSVSVFAFDTDFSKMEQLGNLGVIACASPNEVVKKCKYVFLAVKPQVIEGVLESISGDVSKDTVLVSIAAGITDEFIKSKTAEWAKVVLVMPNTPLLLGEGASALSKSETTSDEEFGLVCDIFSACGDIAVIPKDKMKEIIAINGSSPAFIYLFAKGFVEYAESVGISSEVAKKLFAKTLIGSAKMITDSGYSIDELIKMVSSPGGTTLKGLDELYSGNLTGIVKKACESCTKRAYELSK
ncbi:MAG: pyrroline-5-carboxylate reductase [Oscillospiraceae bacterium]|jgi:pyrroline-5-carboxylate reductase|nr:pyrroline-5-carboxylate reductase [Oscillospiraceae bacterium]